ncbi:MAG: hypothetical protein JNM51_11795 [Bacteroidia bacterium]|nr:hypothetical protein [Bacteroidia bacterium]
MRNPMDRNSTLEQLENSKWVDYDFETNLIKRCHQLRKIPVDKLEIEDLRLLIGQQIGLKFLVDLAVEKLTADILAEGDYYPGDLLNSILSIDSSYWLDNKTQWTNIDNLIKHNQDKLQDVGLKTEKFYIS